MENGAQLQLRTDYLVEVSANTKITCADLIVPERRDLPASRMITVRVAVLHTTTEGRQSDPFLFLMGGQGQGFSVLDNLQPLTTLLQRDVITLEQRGTQLANPFFGCPDVRSGASVINPVLTSQPSLADPDQIALCEEQIDRANVDKNGYDTAASADDLWDLMQLLDIETWNLFGVSYGGRTAESFLRKHPQAARSLTLDSPQVTGITFFFGYAWLNKIGNFFSQRAVAESCGSQFSDLQGHFESTVARLEQTPVSVTIAGKRQSFTASAYIRLVTWILYTQPESAFSQLPAAIVAADEEDYAFLLALEDGFACKGILNDPAPSNYPLALGSHIAQQTAVLCSEEYPYLPRGNGQLDLMFPEGWWPSTQRVAVAEQKSQAWVFDRWDFEPSDPSQGRLPPLNGISALFVHGDHDTIAPSKDQLLLAASYPNSTSVVFPWTGHAIIDRRQTCFIPMLKSFVDHPTALINTTCALPITEPQWLSTAPRSSKPQSYLLVLQTLAFNQVNDNLFPGRTIHVDLRQVPANGTVAVGFADAISDRRLTGKEPSRIASMTKTYTAAAVLRLMEQANLTLDDSVERHLKTATKQMLRLAGYDIRAMTVRQLLLHTSGLPDYNDDGFKQTIAENPHHRWTRSEQVAWALNNSRPTGRPGEVFAYSDTGYVLLGEIIEQASGLPQATAYRGLLHFDDLLLRHT